MMYILYTLYFYRVQVLRAFLNISSSKLNMPSIFIGCGNLRVFRVMSSSIPTKTCEYLQISALYKNRGYIRCGRLYNSKYLYGVRYKSRGYKEYRWCFISKYPQYPHFGLKLSASFLF
jgi:hypothetical protein